MQAAAEPQSFRLVKQLYRNLGHPYDYLFSIISSLPFHIRAAFIKCCQAQFFPKPGLRKPDIVLEHIIKPLLNYRYIDPNAFSHTLLLDHFQDYNGRIFACGMLLDLARSLPITDVDAEAAKLKSWGKEISACEGQPLAPQIDFRPIFDLQYSSLSMCPSVLPSNHRINTYIYSCLVRWRKHASMKTHYPRASDKTMSFHTVESHNSVFDHRVTSLTQEEYLRIEAEYRISLGGKCEMRQRWYPSGFKPRTYYAQGGDAYRASYPLQELFTDLVNCFPVTNHITRLKPSRLWLKESQWFRVYDLTSFTSLMWEQKNFVAELSRFCRGWSFTYVDVREGITTRDMGEVLEEYNDICNILPEVSYHRFDESLRDHFAVQSVASMLGIYGNLMSCTFAHGAVAAQLGADEDQVNVAGDDGMIPETIETMDDTDAAIALLGFFEADKTFFSDEPGCIALKRPLQQLGLSVTHSAMVVWPNCAMLEYWLTNQIPDNRFDPIHFPELSAWDRISAIGGNILRTLRSFQKLGNLIVNEDDCWILYSFCARLEELVESRFNVSLKGGRLTQCGSDFFWPSIPETIDDIYDDPLLRTARNCYHGIALVPSRDLRERRKLWLDIGDTFDCNMDRGLSLLTKLKFVDRRVVMMHVEGEEGYRLLTDSLSHTLPIIYTFTVVTTIPDHLQQL